MGFRCGIVGLPNVGKSSLFNALTQAQVAAENYPFCTIDPHVGRVPVPDLRLQEIARIVQPQKTIPSTMEFVDNAGLVAGASQGEGLGNQFLSHIRETDAIAHVVRCFDNDDIIHVANRVDPLEDMEIIHTELALADLDTVSKSLARVQRKANTGDKEAQVEQQLLQLFQKTLDQGQSIRTLELSPEQWQRAAQYHLLTAKPMMMIANVDEETLQHPDSNAHFVKLRTYCEQQQLNLVPISARLENELIGIPEDERLSLLHEMGLPEPGLNRLIRAGFSLLNLQTYFTAGVKEVRAWTVHRGATAPEAAGVIHTDFTRGFIRAEVIAYDDFIQYKGEQGAKDAGRWRLEGKEYIVKDGDIIYFRFNV